MSIKRRQFLKYLASLGLTLGPLPSMCLASKKSNSTLLSERHLRIIPSSGEKIPAVGLGSWLTFSIDVDDEEELDKRVAILREFLERGGGLLDSSPMYGVAQEVIGMERGGGLLDSSPMYGVAQEVIGIGLKRMGDQKGLFSATKVWTRGNRQGYLQMEDSRLLWGLPSLDLMQVHNLVDWETHLATLRTMKEEREIRYVGVTTSHGRRHEELMRIMRTQSLDFVQFTYNILDREAEQYLLPMANEKGIAVIINRPFQRGGLFDEFENHPLPVWASEIDCANWAQFFLKFIISHPSVTCAIPATSQLAHLRENMAAAYGNLPDKAMRKKMVQYVENL
jgi:diketogulonate reductase-like aldo/keto reductase